MRDWIPVVDQFFTIQGEGVQAGRPAVFIRVAGCNLGTKVCPWCDTADDGPLVKSWRSPGTRMPLTSVVSVLAKAAKDGEVVVFSGGEPLLYSEEFTLLLSHGDRYDVAFETNGSIWSGGVYRMLVTAHNRGHRVLVTLSPKMDPEGKLHFEKRWLDYDLAPLELKVPIENQKRFEEFAALALNFSDQRRQDMLRDFVQVTFQPVANPADPDLHHSELPDLLTWFDESQTVKDLARRFGPQFRILPQIQLLAGLK